MNDIMTRGGFPLMAKTRRVGNRVRVYENLMPYANNFRKTAFLKKKKKKERKKERKNWKLKLTQRRILLTNFGGRNYA